VGGFGPEAHVDVPAGVAWIVGGRKSHRKRPEVPAGKPAPASDQPVEGFVEDWRVGGLDERLLSVHAKPDDRFRPCRRVIRIASGVAPENRAAFLRHLARKGPVDPHEPVSDELLNLRVAYPARAFAASR